MARWRCPLACAASAARRSSGCCAWARPSAAASWPSVRLSALARCGCSFSSCSAGGGRQRTGIRRNRISTHQEPARPGAPCRTPRLACSSTAPSPLAARSCSCCSCSGGRSSPARCSCSAATMLASCSHAASELGSSARHSLAWQQRRGRGRGSKAWRVVAREQQGMACGRAWCAHSHRTSWVPASCPLPTHLCHSGVSHARGSQVSLSRGS